MSAIRLCSKTSSLLSASSVRLYSNATKTAAGKHSSVAFTKSLGIEVPLICGAMYPCSNPELVGAVSAAGGIGIIQPVSFQYIHEPKDLRKGIQLIKQMTNKPLGFNALVEKSSAEYEKRMKQWIDIALEEDVKFFVTSLGNPKWVVDMAHQVGGIVYHDITERKWGMKALDAGVDGLICVNKNAGGHAGTLSAEQLYDDLKEFNVPLICAGGIGDEKDFQKALDMGYAGVQLGTRFIATSECKTHVDYKNAIIKAKADDIVLTEKISGVPVAVINTPYIEKIGTKANFFMRYALKHASLKHYARMFYTIKSAWMLPQAMKKGQGYKDFFQAGKSVESINKVETCEEVVKKFAAAWKKYQ